MRREEWNGHTITYPDEMCFAFNPIIVKVDGNEQDIFTMGVSVDWGEEQQQLQYRAYGGKAIADISAYVQAAFRKRGVLTEVNYDDAYGVNASNVGYRLTMSIGVSGVDDEFTFSTFVVWGSLQLGGKDIYNAPKVLDYFKGYPFSLGIYVKEPINLTFEEDGKRVNAYTIATEGVYELTLDPRTTASNTIRMSEDTGKIIETTFEYVFGETFRLAYAPLIERANIRVHDGCDDCVYLRWIDPHGFYRYYLFEKGSTSYKVESAEYVRNDLRLWDDVNGYGYEAGRNQAFSKTEQLTLVAPLADKDTWANLLTLGSSPRIDAYCGVIGGKHTWMSVNAQAGTYTQGSEDLEDFTLTIDLPTQTLQSL